jgi:hypothetical protein
MSHGFTKFHRFVLILCCCMLSSMLLAQNFASTNYTVGTNPIKVVRADFNGDGKIDLATANNDSTVTILLNNGDGTFRRQDAIAAASAGVTDIFASDVNKDGFADLIVVVPKSDGTSDLNLMIGRGDGTFNAPVTLLNRESGRAAVAADFNGDGNPDIAFGWANQITGGQSIENHAAITVLFGDGHGAFPTRSEMTNVGAQADYANGEGGYQIAYMNVGDFNNDGKTDFAIAECCGGFDIELGATYTYLGNGNGTFTAHALAGVPPFELRVFDLDKNGTTDLLMPYAGCHTPCVGVATYLQAATGTGGASSDLPDPFLTGANGGTADVFYSATAGDFVAGGPRMAVYFAVGTRYAIDPSQSYDGGVLAFAKLNGGSWSLVKSIDTNDRRLVSIVTGDFNGDGLDDIAAIDNPPSFTPGPGTVRVMLNTGTGAGSCSATTNRTVKICSPTAGTTVGGPVHVAASLRSDSGVKAAQIYIDGVKVYQGPAGTTSIDQLLTLAAGTHKITVKGWDSAGSFSSSVTITVTAGNTTCSATTNRTVKICSPTAGSTVSSPVHVVAGLRSDAGISAAQIYLDGVKVYQAPAGTKTVDQNLSMAVGSHRITVKGWDSAGSFSQSELITVH